MPRQQLGAADSFNSSGATIVPDVSERNRRVLQQANDVSTLSSARVLMPQDTLGRELDAALTEDEGQTAAPPVTGSVDWQALGIDDFDFQSASLDQGNPDFASLLQAHTQLPPELIAGLQIGNDTHSPSFRHSASPFNSHSALAVENMVNPAHPGQQYHSHFAQAGGEIDAFRPSSAHSHHSVHSHHSHHSSISASDYSYTSTEVSMDEDVRMDAPDDVLWGLIGGAGKRQDEGVNPAELLGGGKRDIGAVAAGTYPTPGNSAGGPSPPTAIGGMFGPIRGVQETVIEAPGQKQDRLEHRRQINRKSAQKHRARRKEELEDLTRKIAEREARISQLERDLAVEKSRTAQLAGFIKIQIGKGEAEGTGDRVVSPQGVRTRSRSNLADS